LSNINNCHKETARSMMFTLLLQELFGYKSTFIESYVGGIESFTITGRDSDKGRQLCRVHFGL
jgi:hypothetical protein